MLNVPGAEANSKSYLNNGKNDEHFIETIFYAETKAVTGFTN